MTHLINDRLTIGDRDGDGDMELAISNLGLHDTSPVTYVYLSILDQMTLLKALVDNLGRTKLRG